MIFTKTKYNDKKYRHTHTHTYNKKNSHFPTLVLIQGLPGENFVLKEIRTKTFIVITYDQFEEFLNNFH